MESNLKELYPTFILELRHRHEVIWRVRQVYSAMILAIFVVLVRTATPSIKHGIALTVMIFGSLIAVIFTDWRYQKKKVKLLKQLDAVENRLEIPVSFRLGESQGNVGPFYILYVVILLTAVIAICSLLLFPGSPTEV